MSSGAQELYHQYVNGGAAYIDSLIGSEVETGLQDFKLFKSTNPRNWSNDDKSSLSEALSGFANSIGGVVVWGVDCRKGKSSNDPDEVQSVAPIPNLRAVLAEMNTLSTQLVSPALVGVVHTAIPASSADEGFIVSLIPEGESGAYMAMRGNKFMYRAQSSFLPMAQWQVADRFFRRAHPKLKIGWVKAEAQEQGRKIDYSLLILLIRNDGLVVAKHVGFELFYTRSVPLDNIQIYNRSDDYVCDFSKTRSFQGNLRSDFVIHPGRTHEICRIKVLHYPQSTLKIPYELFCEGFYLKDEFVLESEAAHDHESDLAISQDDDYHNLDDHYENRPRSRI